MFFVRKAALAVIASLTIVSASQAGTLGLSSGIPDIFSDNVTLNYQSNHFSASGNNLTMSIITAGDVYDTDSSGVFDLEATIDSSGNLSGGTITLSADRLYDDSVIPPGSIAISPGTVLISGTLTDFAYSIASGGAVFEFRFDATNGLLQSYGFQDRGGVIIGSNDSVFGSSFNSFADSLTGISKATADTIAVPTPAAWSGGAILSGMLLFARKRSRGAALI